MEYLHHLLENSTAPIWSALILGLMTAISPCPLATNITAIGYISKDIKNQRKIFIYGLLYTFGRAFSYTLLGVILYLGASKFHIAHIFQGWGERIIGFILILIGVFMLDIIHLNFSGLNFISDKIKPKKTDSSKGAFLLGVAFALAFCPYSGMLYFGVLIPLTVSSISGLYLPIIFAIATGLPVIITAWILAFSIAKIGTFYNKLKIFEMGFRRIVAIVFILAGLYYLYIVYIK
jgi:cytochrome c-type biogenesis protein